MRATRITLSLSILIAGSLLLGRPSGAWAANEELAAKARDILKANCLECHGDKFTKAGITNILDRELLVSKDKVTPNSAADSLLYQVITAKDESVMPPDNRTKLNAEQIAVIKAWIDAGAPRFPVGQVRVETERGFGMESILGSILTDIRRMPVAERKFMRYFSIAHLMNAGASKAELEIQREALAKTINHLSWKPNLVRPVPIEPTRTVLRIDIRKLGWDVQPFRQVVNNKVGDRSSTNIFDLALLEYPYGMIGHQSPIYLTLVEEFLQHANQVRPVPYVRADWFVSTVTLPPLYEDFLQLPRTIKELETMLGVDREANQAAFKVVRGGVVQSGVSRNNRAMERHATKFGSYWVSFDFQSSIGTDSILNDPVNFKPAGGEMIFTLPNGLQAYYVTNGKGERIEFAPTSIVVDEHASDRTVRNGLSCIRCHERGMKPFTDVVRTMAQRNALGAGVNTATVLNLYPESSKIDAVLKQDEQRFLNAMEQLLGKPQITEPVKPVSQQFLDAPLKRSQAGSELGMNDSKALIDAIRSLQVIKRGLGSLVVGGPVKRDAWQENFESLVRGLKLGVPVVTMDGLTTPDYTPFAPTSPAPFQVEVKTNKPVYTNKEEVVIVVKSNKDVFLQLIGTGIKGRKTLLTPKVIQVKAGIEFRFPPKGQTLKANAGNGKEQITVIASREKFEDGVLLQGNSGVSDRLVHRFQIVSQGQGNLALDMSPNPFKAVKKTVSIEVR